MLAPKSFNETHTPIGLIAIPFHIGSLAMIDAVHQPYAYARPLNFI
ncbi:MAG: hypothetical protein ACI84R_000947 [Candidatus Azotimanducaceae bacterium]|jgi:hypothetical protein